MAIKVDVQLIAWLIMAICAQSIRQLLNQIVSLFVEITSLSLLMKFVTQRKEDVQITVRFKLDFSVLFRISFLLVSLSVGIRLKQELNNVMKEA